MTSPLFPCGRIARRKFIFELGLGFFGTALGGLWAADNILPQAKLAHFSARARSVIFLFMCGGVSHIDTFDPKDNRWAGKLIDAVGFGDNLAAMRRPVIPCRRTFTRYGKSGVPVSDWFPHIGNVIDEIAVVRSMFCHESNHFPAVIEMATGHQDRIADHPCLGSWISYALGSTNQNLPAFVSMGRPSSPIQLSGGYLGSAQSATPFQPGDNPIPNLRPPAGSTPTERGRQISALEQLNREFREQFEIDSAIRGRARAYELAARMQLTAPQLIDFSNELSPILELYGIGEKQTDAFGRQLLLARRLVENDVRFIQICHAGGGNGGWDAHGDVETHGPLCRQIDKPIAGLIRDLKQRGLLDSTLIVWTSEFGRTPWSQNTTGRDHNPNGFTSWLAGGGVRGGIVHGSTDEVGYRAVENRHYLSDLQATILQQMGLDHTKMEVEIDGRPIRLVDKTAVPIQAILG